MNRCTQVCGLGCGKYTRTGCAYTVLPCAMFPLFIWLSSLLGIGSVSYIYKLIKHGYYIEQQAITTRSVWVLYTAPLHCQE